MGQHQVETTDLFFGGDYNPDQWPEEMWAEDIRLMKLAKVNLVTLPVFGWAKLEPVEGRYNFEWLDRILEMLYQNGINFDLATATATPPAWLVRKHPEILPVDFNGVRLEYGSRQSYCISSPIFKQYTEGLVEVMAKRYGTHPGLKFWHVSNEYSDHVARCYCEVSAAAFRNWLTSKYITIDGVNEAWQTQVWGQIYSSFAEIEPPRKSMGPINPAQLLDFERFSSDEMIELLLTEKRVLRAITPDMSITTNFMSINKEIDYWMMAQHEDLVTDDAYPDPADPNAHMIASLNYSMMRSLKKDRPWLLLEQATGAVSWRNVNVPKAPGQMRAMSYHAIAHGSEGAMFFQWRQSKSGAERFHSAMVDHQGESGRIFQIVCELGNELAGLKELVNTRVSTDVGIVVDWDSRWALSAKESLPSSELDYMNQLHSWYRAIYNLGHTVDCVWVEEDFSKYKKIFVPSLMVCTQETVSKFETFVRNGGTLVVGPFSGVVDENNSTDGIIQSFQKLLGVTVNEFVPIAPDRQSSISFNGVDLEIDTWSEDLSIGSAEVMGTYNEKFLAGNPAITLHKIGNGECIYISCGLKDVGLEKIFEGILPAVQGSSSAIEHVTRSNETLDFEFVINHSSEPQTANIAGGVDALSGREFSAGSIELNGFDVLILKKVKESQ